MHIHLLWLRGIIHFRQGLAGSGIIGNDLGLGFAGYPLIGRDTNAKVDAPQNDAYFWSFLSGEYRLCLQRGFMNGLNDAIDFRLGNRRGPGLLHKYNVNAAVVGEQLYSDS